MTLCVTLKSTETCFVFVLFFFLQKYQFLWSVFGIFFSPHLDVRFRCLRTAENIALWRKSKDRRKNTDESGHLARLGHPPEVQRVYIKV